MLTDSEHLLKICGFFRENTDKLVAVAGIVLLLVGLFSLSTVTSAIAASALFLGLSLTFIVALAKVGAIAFYSSPARRLGSMLIVASVFCFSGSLVGLFFQEIVSYRLVVPAGEMHADRFPTYFREIKFTVEHPLNWLFIPLFSISMICLVLGMLLRRH
jgi:uncharacterized membrane protein